MYVRHGIFLQGVDAFDSGAFRLSGQEAGAMDPQARLLLEESAGVLSAAPVLGAACGVFLGCMYSEYLQVLHGAGLPLTPAAITGNGLSYLAGRAAYTFNLRGPAVASDTACSSSLVALHAAHAALANSELAHGLVAGVNCMLLEATTASIAGMGALSPVARCLALDAAADGYGRGEAVAALVLSSGGGRGVDQGLPKDATPALAVVCAAGVNQDGRSSGLTAPSGPAQTALVAQALAAAALDSRELGVLALHGTGTALGDPIELGAALGVLLPADPDAPEPGPGALELMASKSRTLHAEPAAGAVGLVDLAARLARSAKPLKTMHLVGINPYVAAAFVGQRRGAGAAGSRAWLVRRQEGAPVAQR